jgi:RNA 2',3'-cyclic 3'-phosphodiesterase
LVFIGEVEKVNIPRLIDAAHAVRVESFSLPLDQVSAFRNSKVAWIGPMQTPPELTLLVNNLQNALWQAGFGFDNKPFVPHVTLLRKAGWLAQTTLGKRIIWPVKGFALVQSHSETGGVRYVILKRFVE